MNDPRIKVQVKHRFTSPADVSDLRAFMAVLGHRDVGIFVSAGGFTKAAHWRSSGSWLPDSWASVETRAQMAHRAGHK